MKKKKPSKNRQVVHIYPNFSYSSVRTIQIALYYFQDPHLQDLDVDLEVLGVKAEALLAPLQWRVADEVNFTAKCL